MDLNLNFDISNDSSWNNKSYTNDEHLQFIMTFSDFITSSKKHEQMSYIFSENIPLLNYSYVLESLIGKII